MAGPGLGLSQVKLHLYVEILTPVNGIPTLHFSHLDLNLQRQKKKKKLDIQIKQ